MAPHVILERFYNIFSFHYSRSPDKGDPQRMEIFFHCFLNNSCVSPFPNAKDCKHHIPVREVSQLIQIVLGLPLDIIPHSFKIPFKGLPTIEAQDFPIPLANEGI